MTRSAIVLLALALCGLASAAGPPPGERPIVVAGCQGLYYERDGKPDLVIVSDLPLEDSAYTAMHQMTQAIKLTLKDRGFRAGRFTVGYVVCDDSGPAGTWGAGRCARNARAAVRVVNVVGLIGTLDSGCARTELPILGAQKIVLVSPLNTATDLTLSRRGKIARLSAPDDVQAAAAAMFLRAQAARTVAVSTDGTRLGASYETAFLAAARRLGLRVVRRAADAAYMAGVLSSRSAVDLRAARARTPGGLLVLPQSYGPAAQLAAATQGAAEGAYLAVAGIPVERLGSSGRRFAQRFESVLGTPPHPYAVYAAQAARILLNAIAASDGTRMSVARAVLGARVSDGLIGSFSFDANGDPTPAPVTIFRVRAGAPEFVRLVDSAIR